MIFMRTATTLALISLFLVVMLGAAIETDTLLRELWRWGWQPAAGRLTKPLILPFTTHTWIAYSFSAVFIAFNMCLLGFTLFKQRHDPIVATRIFNSWILLQTLLVLIMAVCMLVLFRYGYLAFSDAPGMVGPSPK